MSKLHIVMFLSCFVAGCASPSAKVVGFSDSDSKKTVDIRLNKTASEADAKIEAQKYCGASVKLVGMHLGSIGAHSQIIDGQTSEHKRERRVFTYQCGG